MLSLCMIVRDEEANLPRVLGSVRGLVDETVIVDTGSTDRTIEVARSWGARVDRIEWQDDFAAARNRSLSLANGDWILVLDADDEFEREDIPRARERIGSTVAPALAVRQSVSYPGGTTAVKDQIAFFRRRPEHRYEFRIHERIPLEPSRVERTAIRISHHGYTADALPRKLERNRRILDRMKQDSDPIARVAAAFYLGSQYQNEGRVEDAVREYAVAAYSGVACEFRLYAVLELARASVRKGDFEFGETLYRTLLESNPGLVEAEIGMADLLRRQGKWELSRIHSERARSSTLRILPNA